MLYLVRVRREGEDKLWWVPSKIGLFYVKSFYSGTMGFNNGFRFPWKSVWQTKVPLMVALEKILTIDNLKKQVPLPK